MPAARLINSRGEALRFASHCLRRCTMLNSSLVKSTVVAALGGLLFGFDTVVISGTTQALTDLYHLTPFALGVTVTSALIGTIIGSLTAGIPGDAIGRRDSLRWMAVL